MAVRPGDVLKIPEALYFYGSGDVTLRVTKVRRELLAAYRNEWVWIHGHEVLWDGSESRQEYTFLVSVAALPGRSA
jgi:hypothetical protein